MRETMSPLALSMRYFDSWTNHRFDTASECLSDDVRFEMPINNYASKDAFIQAVEFTAQNASDVILLSAIGNEQEAVLIYEFAFAPIGMFRIAEHFKVKDGKVVLIRHIHDTYELRKMGFGG